MDQYFPRFDTAVELTELPEELAVLMVGVAARQAASPTAARWVRLGRSGPEETLLAPAHGAFNGPVAETMMRWLEEVNETLTHPLQGIFKALAYHAAFRRGGPPPRTEVQE